METHYEFIRCTICSGERFLELHTSRGDRWLLCPFCGGDGCILWKFINKTKEDIDVNNSSAKKTILGNNKQKTL